VPGGLTMKISPESAEFVRQLVRGKSAIVLDEGKQYLIESRLDPLARARRISSIDSLVKRVRNGAADLQTELIEAITTNETTFFRDLRPFEALRAQVLPRLIAARAAGRSLNIWSAGCSTGQEPYSLAMLLCEHFPVQVRWPVRIVATDLARPALERARAGRYRQIEVNRGLPAPLLVKYFNREGAEWVVSPALRDMVDYRQLNLIEPWPHDLRPDLVFMRNVLIYFDVPTKRAILERVRRIIARDGTLFLGTAETTLSIDEGWERHTSGNSSYYGPRP
jgi:chemotaxis protein methyltransferase CheR